MRHARSFDTYSPEVLREISRKGGIASGEIRRKKRAAIEREKITNSALKEMRTEVQRQYVDNLRILRQSVAMLNMVQKRRNQ